jgi:hypothetical protein
VETFTIPPAATRQCDRSNAPWARPSRCRYARAAAMWPVYLCVHMRACVRACVCAGRETW